MPRQPASSRRHRFPVRFIGLGLTALVVLLYALGNPLLDVLESKTYDMRVLRLAPVQADPRIAIAAIDEKSLATLGRWPWPREVLAQLVERLDGLGAQVIVSDVLFAEAQGSADESLRRALARTNHSVLSMVFLQGEEETRHLSDEQAEQALAAATPHEIGIVHHRGEAPPPYDEPGGLLVNVPRLQEATKYVGHINISPDSDGALRWASLVIPYRGHYFAAGDVQAVRAYAGDAPLILRTDGGGIAGLEIGEHFIATDERGRALIRYYGPEQTFTTFSIANLLESNFDPALVKDRIVLLGATAKGIGDIRVTPYSPTFPGVEVRATILQNLLRNDFIQRPSWVVGLDLVVLLILGGSLSFVLPRLRVTPAAALIVALVVAYLAFGVYLFDAQHVWINLVYPVFLLVLLFISTTVVQYFFTERERRQIKSAFQHYVPAKVVDEITQNYELLKLGGDKRELTVLFSDIRGFTSISEALPPEDLVRLLNVYLTRMTEQVFKHDGLLDKYIGDAIMAVYGAPIHRPDHALLACQTALDMMRELRVLQEQWQREKRPSMDIGIGINTGPMIVGNMGSENRFDYTVIGDAVNLGSRIEHMNKDYGTRILMTEFTYEQVKDHFSAVREIDVTTVRGRAAPVRIYELIPDGEYSGLGWLGDFNTARQLFHDGKAAKAKPIFAKLFKTVNDPVSRYYMQRIQARRQA